MPAAPLNDDERLSRAIATVHLDTETRMTRLLSAFRLTTLDYLLLTAIDQEGDLVSTGHLCARLPMSNAALRDALRSLSRRGLILSERGAHGLTMHGADRARAARREVRAFLALRLTRIQPRTRVAIAASLERLCLDSS